MVMRMVWMALVLGVVVGCAAEKRVDVPVEGVMVGNIAPEIQGEDAAGKKLRLSEYRGKVVLLSFWASWCGPCLKLIPHERKMASRFEGRQFALLGVNADKEREILAQVQNRMQISWPSFWDGLGYIGREWNIDFLPVMMVIDEMGYIRFDSRTVMDEIESLDELGNRVEKEVEKVLRKLEAGVKK